MVLMQGAIGGQDVHWKQEDIPEVPGCGSSGRNVRSVEDPVEEEQVAKKLGGEDEEWGDGEMVQD